MTNNIAVLMYHAVGASDRIGALADPHYAVDEQTFRRHVGLMEQRAVAGASVRSILNELPRTPVIAITFDDGHQSNLVAARFLASRGMSADFFVNPSTIGKDGFLTWAELREMAALGMSIQSHGMTHRYMSDLPAAEVASELSESRQQISQEVGEEVSLFAPPGGRMGPGLSQVASDVGYQAICSSVAGVWQQSTSDRWAIPRIAVLNNTSDDQLGRWIDGDAREFKRMQRRYRLLSMAKRLAGNEVYDRIRAVAVRLS